MSKLAVRSKVPVARQSAVAGPIRTAIRSLKLSEIHVPIIRVKSRADGIALVAKRALSIKSGKKLRTGYNINWCIPSFEYDIDNIKSHGLTVVGKIIECLFTKEEYAAIANKYAGVTPRDHVNTPAEMRGRFMDHPSYKSVMANIMYGCLQLSIGCMRCYSLTRQLLLMQRDSGLARLIRFTIGKNRKFNGNFVIDLRKAVSHVLNTGITKLSIVFCYSADLFRQGVPRYALDFILACVLCRPMHKYTFLTKFIDGAVSYFMGDWYERALHIARDVLGYTGDVRAKDDLKNIIVGVSCENQKTYDYRVGELIKLKSQFELLCIFGPLLGPIEPDEKILLMNHVQIHAETVSNRDCKDCDGCQE